MPMEFLILLLEERGRLVPRDEIAARLWPDSGSVDVVQGINAAVKTHPSRAQRRCGEARLHRDRGG
jgi:hypothetical protein